MFKSLHPSKSALSEYRPLFKCKPPSCHSPSESRTLSPCQAEAEGCKKHQKPVFSCSFKKRRVYCIPKGKRLSKACVGKVTEFPSTLTNWWVLRKKGRAVIITQFHSAFLELSQKKSPVDFPGLCIRLSSMEVALLKMEGREASKA